MGRSIKMLAFCTALVTVFSGCSSPLLSDRAILRGILLDRGQEVPWSVTLCWDSLTEGGRVESAAGEGNTLDEALYQARSQLNGEPFYGQLQQILVSDGMSYGQLREAEELFASPQMALPQVAIAVLESEWTQEKEPGQILDQIDRIFEAGGLTANLYEIGRRQNCIVLPVMGDQGLGCRVICQDGRILQWSGGEGQLALILAGLADQYELEWQDGERLCVASGRGSASFVWENSRVQVSLWLTRTRLEGGGTTGRDQQERFRQWVRNGGNTILEQARELDADPFILVPWVKNYNLALGRRLVEENRQPPALLESEVWYAP